MWPRLNWCNCPESRPTGRQSSRKKTGSPSVCRLPAPAAPAHFAEKLSTRRSEACQPLFAHAPFSVPTRVAKQSYEARVVNRAARWERSPSPRRSREVRIWQHDQCHKSVLRYFKPESQIVVTIVFPRSGLRSNWRAAATLAPDENPANIPSSLASRRHTLAASSSPT